MSKFDLITIKQIRDELKYVCRQMIRIAKGPSKTPGYDKYEIDSEEYIRLARKRDMLGDKLRTEWNKR
jgi:hypothetical protein